MTLAPAGNTRDAAGFSCTLLITTKDRREELMRCLESSLQLEGLTEILIFDDGSSDGTAAAVRERFPSFRVERSETPLGIVAARNAAMALATGDIVVTVDDDCIFTSPRTVLQTIADFSRPAVGAVAIPYITPRVPDRAILPASGGEPILASQFIGCASAIRRDVFMALGGYRTGFYRQVEEYDLCTRLLQAGFVVLQGTAPRVEHHESPHRSRSHISYHKIRSHMLYCWYNVPSSAFAAHMAGTIVNTVKDAVRERQYGAALRGPFGGLGAILRDFKLRAPVSVPVYRLARRIRKAGPVKLSEIETALPRPHAVQQTHNTAALRRHPGAEACGS